MGTIRNWIWTCSPTNWSLPTSSQRFVARFFWCGISAFQWKHGYFCCKSGTDCMLSKMWIRARLNPIDQLYFWDQGKWSGRAWNGRGHQPIESDAQLTQLWQFWQFKLLQCKFRKFSNLDIINNSFKSTMPTTPCFELAVPVCTGTVMWPMFQAIWITSLYINYANKWMVVQCEWRLFGRRNFEGWLFHEFENVLWRLGSRHWRRCCGRSITSEGKCWNNPFNRAFVVLMARDKAPILESLNCQSGVSQNCHCWWQLVSNPCHKGKLLFFEEGEHQTYSPEWQWDLAKLEENHNIDVIF